MSAHAEEHFAGSNKLFTSIWVWLVVLTLIEIFLAYRPMSILLMLTILLGLSIIKAALIVAYFMHLKFERLSLILTIVPMLVVCICLLFVFFPDSFRAAGLRYQFKEARPRPQQRSIDGPFESKVVVVDYRDVGRVASARDFSAWPVFHVPCFAGWLKQRALHQKLQHWRTDVAGAAGNNFLFDFSGTASLARD